MSAYQRSYRKYYKFIRPTTKIFKLLQVFRNIRSCFNLKSKTRLFSYVDFSRKATQNFMIFVCFCLRAVHGSFSSEFWPPSPPVTFTTGYGVQLSELHLIIIAKSFCWSATAGLSPEQHKPNWCGLSQVRNKSMVSSPALEPYTFMNNGLLTDWPSFPMRRWSFRIAVGLSAVVTTGEMSLAGCPLKRNEISNRAVGSLTVVLTVQ